MNFFPDFAPNSRKGWRLSLFDQICENKLEICRNFWNFWNLWKLFNIVQNYSIVSLEQPGAAGGRPRRETCDPARARPAKLFCGSSLGAHDPRRRGPAQTWLGTELSVFSFFFLIPLFFLFSHKVGTIFKHHRFIKIAKVAKIVKHSDSDSQLSVATEGYVFLSCDVLEMQLRKWRKR